MKKMIFGLMITIASCSHAPTAKEVKRSLNRNDISRISELHRVWNIAGDKAWPGFKSPDFDLRFILLTKNAQWAINVDPTPFYYRPTEIPKDLFAWVKHLAVTEAYRNEFGEKEALPREMHRSLPPEFMNFHYKNSVYFVTSIEGFQTENQEMTSDDWIHISLHELFHNFQDRDVKYSKEFIQSISFPNKAELQTDYIHNNFLVSELKYLGLAACETDPRKIKKYLSLALEVRNKRWTYAERKFPASLKQWERYSVWAEGTAHYVEHKIMALWPLYAEQSELKRDSHFNNYSSYKNENQAQWCQEISGYSHSYWYDLGFAYSLILDKLAPNWKSIAPDNQLFFDAYFKSLNLRDSSN